MPRAFDFRQPLRFNDLIDVTISVTSLGRSSMSYAITVSGPDGVAAEGEMTVALVDRETGATTPWPSDLRRILTEAGPAQ